MTPGLKIEFPIPDYMKPTSSKSRKKDMKDYANSIHESTFGEFYRDMTARAELNKHTKKYEKLNKQYQKILSKLIEAKSKLEIQNAILKSI